MATVTLDSRPVLAGSFVMPEALSSCCAYLLERIAEIWQAVCGWITQLFAKELPPLPISSSPLPQQLVLHILKFSSPEESISVSKINKFFQQAFKKWLQQTRCLEFVCDAKFYNSLQGKIFSSPLPALRTLTLFIPELGSRDYSIDPKSFADSLLKHAPGLTAINLRGDSDNRKFEAVIDLLPKFANMQAVSLEVTHNAGLTLAGRIPQLKNLSITNVQDWAICAAFQTFAAREQLETLKIQIGAVPVATMQEISSFPKLRSVTILSYFYYASRLLPLFNLPQLRELHFEQGLVNCALHDLPENNLEVLSIESIMDKIQSCESLSRCKNLKRLTLSCQSAGNQARLFSDLARCPTLETLVLANVPFDEYATQDLLALIDRLPNLKEIDLSGCIGQIDKDAIKLASIARSPSLLYSLP